MTSKIVSFAVFDLETANLPSNNFNKTKITEISIHGFKAEDISNAINCNHPRINHKLTLLFNPSMMIHPESEQITGLNNYMLENESIFDANAANVIVNFLKHLRQPVCLVAHNGDDFDFRILKHTLSQLGLELPNDILCLDSLGAIKDLDLAKEAADMNSFTPLPVCPSDLQVEILETAFKIENMLEQSKKDSLTDLEVNIPASNSKIDTSDECTSSSKNDENKELIEENGFIISSDTQAKIESPDDWQKFNETTPRRPPNVVNGERKRKRQMDKELSITFTATKSQKSLSFNSTPTKIKSYKLSTIYERLFGHPPELAHHAEADVITLKKIMLAYGKSFVEYAEKNAKKFSEVKKLGAR